MEGGDTRGENHTPVSLKESDMMRLRDLDFVRGISWWMELVIVAVILLVLLLIDLPTHEWLP